MRKMAHAGGAGECVAKASQTARRSVDTDSRATTETATRPFEYEWT